MALRLVKLGATPLSERPVVTIINRLCELGASFCYTLKSKRNPRVLYVATMRLRIPLMPLISDNDSVNAAAEAERNSYVVDKLSPQMYILGDNTSEQMMLSKCTQPVLGGGACSNVQSLSTSRRTWKISSGNERRSKSDKKCLAGRLTVEAPFKPDCMDRKTS
jgi:hypothetical protein